MSPAPRRPRLALSILVAAAASAVTLAAGTANADPAFTLFESGQVRPLALSPDGKLLFVVNTPDNRLEIFRVQRHGLEHQGSVPVGLEPVAVAARNDHEVWVVNHLSDSISIVDVDAHRRRGRVTRTLLVGDEPRDIVFAGPGRKRAFITTAHRGQNIPFDPQLTTAGIGRADVWVFDAQELGGSLGGNPLSIITLFADTPRALTVTPDGRRVYAAAFHSGNRTATVNEVHVPDGFGTLGVPGPTTNFEGHQAPEVGVLAQWNGTNWLDAIGGVRDDQIKFFLPDKDVFTIDAMGDPPVAIDGPGGVFARVGTVLFNMAVNPVSGKVYVSNTDANNMDRFEGPGIFAGHSLRGHLHESRISVLNPANGSVTPRHLNKHIDYNACCEPAPNAESVKSLAQPTEMAITPNGKTLFVAALGSSKVGVYKTAELEADTFVPSTANQIAVTGGGPSGLVLDDRRDQLYVLTRFDNAISVIDTNTKTEIAHVAMHTPEPPSIVNGRRFLYDAALTSSHGDSSCASCHIFGDFDSLAWDLGNPDAAVANNPAPFAPNGDINFITGQPIVDPKFHPMKGPMTTQSLRGMANHGSMHWRGDRHGEDFPNAHPDGGVFNERQAFERFQDGFTDLLGRNAHLSPEEMAAFTDFILEVVYPPNPIRQLDNSLTLSEAQGRDIYFQRNTEASGTCNGCHILDPGANPGASRPGFFGGNGQITFDFETQEFKVPHLRNAYQKVGMFGFPASFVTNPFDNEHKGDQVRGFGYIHDGSFDTLFRFMNAIGFSQNPINPDGFTTSEDDNQARRDVDNFLFAFETNLKPIVGQQITLRRGGGATVDDRIGLLIARADAGDCELIAKSWAHGRERGYAYVGAGMFTQNRAAEPAIADAALRAIAGLHDREVTYTCVPSGSGRRLGIDRDADGCLDGDEEDAGTDPANPLSRP